MIIFTCKKLQTNTGKSRLVDEMKIEKELYLISQCGTVVANEDILNRYVQKKKKKINMVN